MLHEGRRISFGTGVLILRLFLTWLLGLSQDISMLILPTLSPVRYSTRLRTCVRRCSMMGTKVRGRPVRCPGAGLLPGRRVHIGLQGRESKLWRVPIPSTPPAFEPTLALSFAASAAIFATSRAGMVVVPRCSQEERSSWEALSCVFIRWFAVTIVTSFARPGGFGHRPGPSMQRPTAHPAKPHRATRTKRSERTEGKNGSKEQAH